MTKTILTVDDSTTVRQMVSFTLTGAGYNVVEAKDGQDALAKLGQPPSMVLTDLNMPTLDGIGLIKRLRAHRRSSMYQLWCSRQNPRRPRNRKRVWRVQRHGSSSLSVRSNYWPSSKKSSASRLPTCWPRPCSEQKRHLEGFLRRKVTMASRR
jgi:Response regulator receiver domain